MTYMGIRRIAAPFVYTLESVEPLRNGFVEFDSEDGTVIRTGICDDMSSEEGEVGCISADIKAHNKRKEAAKYCCESIADIENVRAYGHYGACEEVCIGGCVTVFAIERVKLFLGNFFVTEGLYNLESFNNLLNFAVYTAESGLLLAVVIS